MCTYEVYDEICMISIYLMHFHFTVV